MTNAFLNLLVSPNLETTTTTTYTNVVTLDVQPPTCSVGGGATPTCTNLYAFRAGASLFTGLVTGTAGLTISGGAISVNLTGANNVSIASTSNSGTVAIGNASSAAVNIGGATVKLTGLATSSAAQTGTVCSGTGGLLTVDTTTTCLASSRRWKEHISALDAGIDELMKLKPVSYDLKPAFNPAHLGRQIGLIAEDVQAVDPRLVGLDKDGKPNGVRYQQMVALLVKAVQEQQAEITQLRKRVAELKH